MAEPGSARKLSKRKLDAYLKNPDFAKVHEHGTAIASAMRLTVSPETFNPVIVDFYEQVGYLPEAMVNYLVLLGWSLDDKTEFLTREQMVAGFSLERVNTAPASFDPTKLLAFQLHYMRELPLAEKVAGVLPFLERAGLLEAPVSDAARAHVARVVETLGDRLRVFGDILLQGAFFFGEEVAVDEKAFAKRVLAPGAVDKLTDYRDLAGGARRRRGLLRRRPRARHPDLPRRKGPRPGRHRPLRPRRCHRPGGRPWPLRLHGRHRPRPLPPPHRPRPRPGPRRGGVRPRPRP